MMVSIRYAVIATDVEAATIRQWASRGQVTTMRNEDGIVLYDLPSLMRREAATRSRRQNLTMTA